MKRITIILIVLLIVLAIYYYKPSTEQKEVHTIELNEQDNISEIAIDQQQCSTSCCGLSSYSCGNGDGGTGCPCISQKGKEHLSGGRSVAVGSLTPYNSSTYDEYAFN
jgi:hypothetical protein